MMSQYVSEGRCIRYICLIRKLHEPLFSLPLTVEGPEYLFCILTLLFYQNSVMEKQILMCLDESYLCKEETLSKTFQSMSPKIEQK